jgi:nucleoside-diphosphate-sugar epimerase
MDTIMVTGGPGFTGRHITARLTAGARSVVSYNRDFAPREDGVTTDVDGRVRAGPGA